MLTREGLIVEIEALMLIAKQEEPELLPHLEQCVADIKALPRS